MKRLILVCLIVLVLLGGCLSWDTVGGSEVSIRECGENQIFAAQRCWKIERVQIEGKCCCYSLEAVGYINMVEFVCK